MKHTVTRTLYDYWTHLRGHRTAPDRHEVEPGDIRHILGDTFILEAVDRRTYSFRLAGTRICAAYCRELKGRNALDLWQGKDREAMANLLATIVEDGAAAIIGLAGHTERDHNLPIEMMFLPLRHGGSSHTRILGCFAPYEQPYWLGLYPIVRQPVLSLRLIWPDERPTFLRHGTDDVPVPSTLSMPTAAMLREAAPVPAEAARRVAHLTVYEGGKN